VKSIFSTGVAAGGITAILLNLLLPETRPARKEQLEQELEQALDS
jgi:xanthine permease XanP